MGNTVLPWTGKQRCLAWAMFAIFLVGFVLFFVSYVGTSWYVVPVENNAYPPDNPIPPFTMGLFYMCYRGHCKYDLRQDYFVVNLIPQSLSITWAYQHIRVVCMGIETTAAIICLVTLGVHLLFLSGFSFSHYVGFATGGLEILAGVLSLIGVVVFGGEFRGSTETSPFGWSFGLMIVAFIILILNGVATIIFSVVLQRYQSRAPKTLNASGDDSRPMIVQSGRRGL